MPLDTKDAARLWDMLDAARAVVDFTVGLSFEHYIADRKTRNAVERNLEIIGKAARHVSEDARQLFPDIPWTSIIGVRNIIAHEYGEVLQEKVWAISIERIPALIRQLEGAGLPDPPPTEDI